MENFKGWLPTEELLFSGDENKWEEKYFQEFHLDIPFIYDAAFQEGIEAPRPWETSEMAIPRLLEQWHSLKDDLARKFANRDRANAGESMKFAICLFIEMLYWTNGIPVHFPLDNMDTLKAKPMNIEDRVSFIMSQPNHYQSYKQLAELMIEQEKLFAKTLLLKKIKKNVRE
ncbi:YpoC family protein [Mesobacillus foraminis]|uniref:YpoC family protein n=1 Tax=Mesobacillus foraminis TaxID=279826 RepID=UPI000EF442A7|nr:hypothetical protein [Mesobacillus foraminis]